jgi:hypothetical protein
VDLAVAIEMADDNAGPHSLEETRKIYADGGSSWRAD